MSSSQPVCFRDGAFEGAGMRLEALAPLLDGVAPACGTPVISSVEDGWLISWEISGAASTFTLAITPAPSGEAGEAGGLALSFALEGAARAAPLQSIGMRIGYSANVVRYLRNGYTSWDGSYFVELETARPVVSADARARTGYAMTTLVSDGGDALVLGFLRHDRFQSQFRFAFAEGPLQIDLETLLDGAVSAERIGGEPLLLMAGAEVEQTLRRWARAVATASPEAPRTPQRRISGWCSWYSLYSSINEPLIREHLAAAARFRDRHHAPFDIFQIDDGFTPEMGDWLEVKPQFPRGMRPLLAEIRAAGFTPGLWIAPFMVGNRSRLYAEHPDWVVTQRDNNKPIAPMTFYGEFRWHKRSEEYYVLDITHPAAEAYIRDVFRTWRRDWGCGYFKTDFMYFGSEYGPREARWHVAGLSRIEIWRRMARLIRAEIGDASWLGCGGPIWAATGLMDAVRIGRDIGVSWEGRYSAESLLRDQTTRNFANGILWQADPDCILLRERFHDLSDEQVRSLALFAGLAGGVLMTSDQLDEVPEARRALFAQLALDASPAPCDFPQLGRVSLQHRIGASHTGQPALLSSGDPVLVQRVRQHDGAVTIVLYNTGAAATMRSISWSLAGVGPDANVVTFAGDVEFRRSTHGVELSLPPYAARGLTFHAA